jgi:xanthine dehydrogenase accessory factor
MKFNLLKELNLALRQRQSVAIVTNLDNGDQRIVYKTDLDSDLISEPIKLMFNKRKSGSIIWQDQNFFISIFEPPLRLIIIGAGRIAQALVGFAGQAGYQTIVIDPRDVFATAERFPNTQLLIEWPDIALNKLKPDKRTAVICLSHDPKIDDLTLKIALNTDSPYVGVLGSRKSHQSRVNRLMSLGISEDLIKRIHAPIGIDIGAQDPVEIAISIIAEIVLVTRKKDLRSE